MRQSNTACQAGDFDKAVVLYTEAIALDKCNHILYSNRSTIVLLLLLIPFKSSVSLSDDCYVSRSAAYIKMGQFTKAHQDAVKAKELNSEWANVGEREGEEHHEEGGG